MNKPPNRNHSPEADLWPIIDREQDHVRTPTGTIIPLPVIRTFVAFTAVLFGLEATFGLTNWVSIPAFVLAIAWGVHATDGATIHHAHHSPPENLNGEDL